VLSLRSERPLSSHCGQTEDCSFMSARVIQLASFGGGCFWGVEKYFRKQFGKGLASIYTGYMGGTLVNPSYKDVCTGKTGHAEVVQIQYFPDEVKYEDLLTLFWRIHNPTTLNRQGNDVGTQYRSAVFYHTPEQKAAAEKVKAEIQAAGKFKEPIVTEIVPASTFFKAEDYHQDYLTVNEGGYCNHKFYW